MVDADAVRSRVRTTHGDLLDEVTAAADAVAADWPEGGVRDRERVVPPLRAALDERSVTARLPDVLRTAVDATGHDLPAALVPAPPYVVVTSRGPLLRATLSPGRLLVAVEVFAVDWDPVRYRRRPARVRVELVEN